MNWGKVKLSFVINKLESGSRPKGGVSIDGDVPSLGAEHLRSDGGYNFDKLKKVSSEYYNSIKNGKIEKEDILIVKDGATTGKVSYVNNNFPFESASINEHLFRLKINTNIAEPRFVFYYLFSDFGKREILLDFRGATVGGISRGFIEKVQFVLPPLETQKKIAAILDKADELRRNDQKILEKYDQLARSVFLEMFGDPVRNEKGWKISNLKALSIIIRDGPFGSNLKSEHYVNQGVRVIRLQNIGINEFINNDKAYISEEHFETIKKHTCKRGDVLVATLGDPNVRACKFPIFLDKAINKADCVQIRPKTGVLNDDYLIYLLNSPAILYWVGGMLHGQTRTRVSMGQLSTINIPKPPLTLQNNFAEIIKHIETQKQLTQQSLQKSENLFQSLLQRAFKGELG